MDISVIIPTYNEEFTIGQTISYLKNISNSDNIGQIIVVDGYSTDNTVREAEKHGAEVHISYKKGRAVQMNCGAWYATGNILYFLHSDSYPPENFDRYIIDCIKNNSLSGSFRMKFDDHHWLLNLSCWFTRFKWDICNGGDQSLFITRDMFEKISGFNEKMHIMEDIEIIQRIKKQTNFSIVPHYVTTSARRYKKNGVFKLQSLFTLIHFFYYCRCSQEFILRFYKSNIN